LTSLTLAHLNLLFIDKTDFTGFGALTSLWMDDCGIVEIDHRSFYPLSRAQPSGKGLASSLRYLHISRDKKLTNFPWNALYPLASSLKSITLSENSELLEISFVAPNTDGMPSMRLRKLEEVEFLDGQLTTLLEAVIKTFPRQIKSQNTTISVQFKGNQNQCGGCGLNPLVNWIRAPGNADCDLVATCREMSNGTITPLTHSHAFWLTYPTDDCQGTAVMHVQRRFFKEGSFLEETLVVDNKTQASSPAERSSPKSGSLGGNRSSVLISLFISLISLRNLLTY